MNAFQIKEYHHARPLARKLGLSRSEAEVVFDRLANPDLFAEIFADVWPPKRVIEVAEALYSKGWDAAVAMSPEIAAEVLAECIEGSTWRDASAEQFPGPMELARAVRAFDWAKRKVEKFLGRNLTV